MNGTTQTCGWYGKLPSAGDFVARGLQHDVQARVEEWIGNGLIQLRYRLPDWQYLFAQSPMWSFVLPRGVLADEPLLGCLAPSTDRVGRQFPVVALRGMSSSATLEADLPPHGRWHAATTELIVDAHADAMSIEAFDEDFVRLSSTPVNGHDLIASTTEKSDALGDIFAVLGAPDATSALGSAQEPSHARGDLSFSFSWPELLTLFDASGQRSFWWTLGGGAVSRRLAHDGELTSHLFITLFTQAMHADGNASRV
ncbi:MAG: type VI secretion system-associated protein TagF [Casimicrobium sp.]